MQIAVLAETPEGFRATITFDDHTYASDIDASLARLGFKPIGNPAPQQRSTQPPRQRAKPRHWSYTSQDAEVNGRLLEIQEELGVKPLSHATKHIPKTSCETPEAFLDEIRLVAQKYYDENKPDEPDDTNQDNPFTSFSRDPESPKPDNTDTEEPEPVTSLDEMAF